MSRLRVLRFLLIATSLAFASNATAEKPPPRTAPLSQTLSPEAKVDYDAGKALLNDGDFSSALMKFSAAYAKSHDPRILWNMAVGEKSLRHYSKVIALLRQYIDEGASLLTAKDVQEAEELVWALQALVAPLTLDVSEQGAAIFVDDELVGRSPLAKPIALDIGTRKLRVEKADYRPFATSITVAGGAAVTLAVKLEKQLHDGHLAVTAGAGDTISIDGNATGKGRWEGALPSGAHALHVEAKGMRAYDIEVTIQDRQTRTLTVTLEPEKKEFPTWLLVTAGGVAAAGLAVGGYFLFRPAPEQPPGPSGTFDPGQAIAGFRH